MGQLVEGKWKDDWYDTKSTGGKFVRPNKENFRSQVDGGRFKAEKDRYHLYISYACPWAHRVLLFRHFKKLQDIIPISVVSPKMEENGWTFEAYPGSTDDQVYKNQFLYQLYLKADPTYSGRVTVPVLWDKKEETIVNNESSELIRIFNSAFDELTGNSLDFYPQDLRGEIDSVNELVYESINNGVYKSGFATSQEAYDESFKELFSALDQVEKRLEGNRFLCGDRLTEADWRLFTTLLRFDPVYFGHFKCNLRRISDYVELWDYLKCLYQAPGVEMTCHMNHIKTHYYYSHKNINPTQVIPLGPEQDLGAPTKRVPIDFAKDVAQSK